MSKVAWKNGVSKTGSKAKYLLFVVEVGSRASGTLNLRVSELPSAVCGDVLPPLVLLLLPSSFTCAVQPTLDAVAGTETRVSIFFKRHIWTPSESSESPIGQWHSIITNRASFSFALITNQTDKNWVYENSFTFYAPLWLLVSLCSSHCGCTGSYSYEWVFSGLSLFDVFGQFQT